MINYYSEYKKLIECLKTENDKKRLLLHVCCAPCSSAVLAELDGLFDITLFFYNPNITDKKEYDFRLKELKRFIKEAHSSITIIDGGFEPEAFYAVAKEYAELKEGGKRCFNCYRLRLEKTARLALEQNFDYFCTTLSVSPYKNSSELNKIGAELAEVYGKNYLLSDFKKKDGYHLSVKLCEKYNLYRQNYCGCEYSLLERERAEKLVKKDNLDA